VAPIDSVKINREPDFSRTRAALERRRGAEVPFFELMVDPVIVSAVLGKPWPEEDGSPRYWRARFRLESEFYARLGYDAFTVRIDTGFPRARREIAGAGGDRKWINETSSFIRDRETFECFNWPRLDRVDLSPLEIAAEAAPDGMMLIPRTSGVFENASWLVGIETLAFLLMDDPELVEALFRRVGEHIAAVHETMAVGPRVGATLLGDDLGFRSATMISPDDLRRLVFPYQARCVRAAHAAGVPMILHSCGNLTEVMRDLVETVGIDAKHSYEDAIAPVEQVHRRWGDRLAILGGVDVDLLSRGTEEEVRRRTRQIIEDCAPRGGYALGSGNSVADYVRLENYLAMLEEGARWRS